MKEKGFLEEKYEEMIGKLFLRFPSFQKDGASAYKPGIANMEFMDQLLGHPHKQYKIIHVAGTNGKGSVSNMLASVLAFQGLKVGLYTSPHILDFRERMKVICHPEKTACQSEISREPIYRCVPQKYVFDFVTSWQETFDHLDLSFFEITTAMALQWFADEKVDVVVLETGLGGRLDSTNIVTPILSIVTNIGLDHCDMLGETLPEIAFEKAGIIKPMVPVVIGESCPETDNVFERKVLYTNLPEPDYMGDRARIMSLLTFADKVEPSFWDCHESLLSEMDLQGTYQKKNLRTVLAALDVLGNVVHAFPAKPWMLPSERSVSSTLSHHNCGRSFQDALINTAKRTGFRGRWEKLSDSPMVICDIGHNEHGLRYNFSQLVQMNETGICTDLIIIYGSVADKDVDAALRLMPHGARYIFTQAQGKRALPAEKVLERFLNLRECDSPDAQSCGNVPDAVLAAKKMARQILHDDPSARPLIYIGGSTYVVSEAASFAWE